jgi:hypothetical protein
MYDFRLSMETNCGVDFCPVLGYTKWPDPGLCIFQDSIGGESVENLDFYSPTWSSSNGSSWVAFSSLPEWCQWDWVGFPSRRRKDQSFFQL